MGEFLGDFANSLSISSRKNKSVVLMRSLLRERAARRENALFAVEGDHLCGELARMEDIGVKLFLFTERALGKYPSAVEALRDKCRNNVGYSFCITEELAEYISDTRSPQGLFAACGLPKREIPAGAQRLVVLDGVQDPGNVGTVIRTAEAMGFDGVVCTGACADVYSPKTLRASMGSALRMPIVWRQPQELRGELSGFTLYAAMLDKGAKRLGAERFPQKTAVVIGSEGGGVSPEVKQLCDEKLYIPIKGAESLNAAIAAAVIMWEISK